MNNTAIEHSFVIYNFISEVHSQLRTSMCRALGDSVQYEWTENDNKIVIPDATILCNARERKNVFITGVPKFVMEVLSAFTEHTDRTFKMDLYGRVGVSEYWIVDWRSRTVEIYLYEGRDDGSVYSYLYKTVSESNKDELRFVTFPHLKISFDNLFDMGD